MFAPVVRLMVLAAAAAVAPVVRADDPPKVRVTVVTVLATTENNVIDPRLTALAKAVQQREPTLIGFKLAACAGRSVPVGGAETFRLVDKQELKVAIDRPRGVDGRIGLTITPPGLGEIGYECACSKFFPVVTPHVTAAGEQLIVAVMAKPCTAK